MTRFRQSSAREKIPHYAEEDAEDRGHGGRKESYDDRSYETERLTRRYEYEHHSEERADETETA